MTPIVVHPIIDTRLALSSCLRCRRRVSAVDRKYDKPADEPHRCGFCSMPLTPEAKATLPTAQGEARC